jgi:hypothetical protein
MAILRKVSVTAGGRTFTHSGGEGESVCAVVKPGEVFTVAAAIENASKRAPAQVTATIHLPPEYTLTGGKESHSEPAVEASGAYSPSWKVRAPAEPGAVRNTIRISMEASIHGVDVRREKIIYVASEAVPTNTKVWAVATPGSDIVGMMTLEAKVSAMSPYAEVPHGTLQFSYDSIPIGSSVTLDPDGCASSSPQLLAPGTHTIAGEYNSSKPYFFESSYGSANQEVDKFPATTDLTFYPSAPVFGETIHFLATVTASEQGFKPSGGSIQLMEIANGTKSPIGPAQMLGASGSAAIPIYSLPVGPHEIIAAYSGDSNFEDSTSNPVTPVVRAARSCLKLSSNPADSAELGDLVAFTAQVSAEKPGSGIPTGTVQFTACAAAGDVALGSANLDNKGSATIPPPAFPQLALGDYTIRAVYKGDGNFDHSHASIPFIISQTTVELTGYVMTADGNPLSGVTVTATDLQGKVIGLPATSGNDGSYKLTVDCGEPMYVVYPGSHEAANGTEFFLRGPKSTYLQPEEDTQLGKTVFELRIARVSGFVKQQIPPSNVLQNLPGVGVTLLDQNLNKIDSYISDADGSFYLNTNKPDNYILQFDSSITTAAGVLTTPSTQYGIVVPPDQPAQLPASVIYSPAPAQVIGQVTDGKHGLPLVTVQLFSAVSNQTLTYTTGPSGSYLFSDVPPGSVTLSFPNTATDSAGNVWELQSNQPGRQTFVLASNDFKTIAPIAYQPKQNTILWIVKQGNQGVPNVLVEVRTQDGTQVVQAQRTVGDGTALFTVDKPGHYSVWVYPDERQVGGVLTQAVEV